MIHEGPINHNIRGRSASMIRNAIDDFQRIAFNEWRLGIFLNSVDIDAEVRRPMESANRLFRHFFHGGQQTGSVASMEPDDIALNIVSHAEGKETQKAFVQRCQSNAALPQAMEDRAPLCLAGQLSPSAGSPRS